MKSKDVVNLLVAEGINALIVVQLYVKNITMNVLGIVKILARDNQTVKDANVLSVERFYILMNCNGYIRKMDRRC